MLVGWIGTGVMGAPMAAHVMEAGHTLQVFTRTRERAAALEERGAAWCASPAEAATGAAATCVMVGYPQDVEAVVLGPAGVLEGAQRGSAVVDFTTSSPELARRMAEAAVGRGVRCLDAPVSGGDVGAREATLSIMVGGDRGAYDDLLPLLRLLGRTVVYQGPAGRGQHTKMVNQLLIASTMVGVCEGLLYARRAGLEPERVLESVAGGAAASWSLSHLLPRMLAGDYEPGFYVEHFLKDMRIGLEESRRMGLTLPGLKLAERLYRKLEEMGHGRKGTQALILALDGLQADEAEPPGS